MRKKYFRSKEGAKQSLYLALASIQSWPRIRWLIAITSAFLVFLVIALPTAIIPNPVFGREIDVTWWSIPILSLNSVFSGLLLATYTRVNPIITEEKSLKLGGAATFLTFFAVGCPVCNKLVLIALGYSGAITYFAPIQPILGLISLALLIYVFFKRVLNEGSCKISPRVKAPQ